MEFAVLLITTSAAIRDAVERVLVQSHIAAHHAMSVRSAADTVTRGGVSAVLCTAEIDWRELIATVSGSGEIGRPVVLLMPDADHRLWASALMAGAFDAVALTDRPDVLVTTVEKARARWLRARSVREALRQNAVARNVA